MINGRTRYKIGRVVDGAVIGAVVGAAAGRGALGTVVGAVVGAVVEGAEAIKAIKAIKAEIEIREQNSAKRKAKGHLSYFTRLSAIESLTPEEVCGYVIALVINDKKKDTPEKPIIVSEILMGLKENLKLYVIESDDEAVTAEQKIKAQELINLLSERLKKEEKYLQIKKSKTATPPDDTCIISGSSYKDMLSKGGLPVLLNVGENSHLFDLEKLTKWLDENPRNPMTNLPLTVNQLFSHGDDRVLYRPITEQEAQKRREQDAEKKRRQKANKLAFKALESKPNP